MGIPALVGQIEQSQLFHIRFCNGADENLLHHFVVGTVLAVSSQKLVPVLRILFPCKGLHTSHDSLSWRNGVDFFHKHHCKILRKNCCVFPVGLQSFAVFAGTNDSEIDPATSNTHFVVIQQQGQHQ